PGKRVFFRSVDYALIETSGGKLNQSYCAVYGLCALFLCFPNVQALNERTSQKTPDISTNTTESLVLRGIPQRKKTLIKY
ncbi:hypothetical protein, partial [Gracilibacillus sp. YIM 98692]|uniref:hypothetical protein n=1 Tax=Gracilibacillus sp. YIM 98692 TaxID=2663532 RepID=UPI001969CB95